MKTLALTALAQSINHYLALDEDAAERLAKMTGKVIAFHLKRPKLTLFFIMRHDSVHIEENYDGEPDTHIYTSLFQMMKMKLGNKIGRDGFYVEGDADVAAQLYDLVLQHDIDWEEHLSRIVGDTLAFKLGKFAKAQRNFAGKVGSNMRENVTEYLQEETNALPPKKMVENFYVEVDALQMKADRLQARFDHLVNQRSGERN